MKHVDWASVRFVVFDVDGTLYRQTPLRLRMALALGLNCLVRGGWQALLILRTFRRVRESFAEREITEFDVRLYREVSDSLALDEALVREVVRIWIEERPLAALAACRYRGVSEMFDQIRNSGRKIGILSDYPIADKLRALGLNADYTVSATDRDVGVLKPNPRGLEKIMDLANETPSSTLVIGDRDERDGEIARKVGAAVLIINKHRQGAHYFKDYRVLSEMLLATDTALTRTTTRGPASAGPHVCLD